MKKILATLAVSGLSMAAFAQGYINWTGAGGLVIVQTNGTAYSSYTPAAGNPTGGSVGGTLGNNAANNAALGYSGYYYELLTSATASAAPATAAGFSAWSDTGLGSTNSSATGGKTIQANSSTLAQVNNWPANTTQAILLVGWSANMGSSWATVLTDLQNWGQDGGAYVGANAAYFGTSSVGSGVLAVASTGTANQVIGNSGGSEIYNPAANPMQLNVLAVNSVPEPATFALAAIGGASLLLFRRKK